MLRSEEYDRTHIFYSMDVRKFFGLTGLLNICVLRFLSYKAMLIVIVQGHTISHLNASLTEHLKEQALI